MRVGDGCLHLECLPVGLRGRDIVGPGLDDLAGPVGPALDHEMEVDEELADEDEPWEALGKRSPSGEVGLGDGGIGAQPFVAPFAYAGERCEQVLFGRVFREEHFDQLFELEDGAVAGRCYPFLQGATAFGGDGVDGALAFADRLG